MLSDFIIRSTAAFGGAPFRLNKCTALGSAGAGAAAGSTVGGVPGALVGGALGVASSLLGGLFGKSNTNKTNEMNYRIMQEQNRFNAEEAKKNRDWQELMYRMFGTSSAKANDMRAAGLNALLGDVSASGNVGSGASATAAESAQMLPTDYSFIGDAANHGLAAYNTTRSVDASVSLQKSQENVNKSIEGVNMAQKGLMESQTAMQKMTYKFAQDTYQNRLLQEQFKAELENWRGFDAMYDARLKAFSLYNVMPTEVEKNVAQTMSFYASAFSQIINLLFKILPKGLKRNEIILNIFTNTSKRIGIKGSGTSFTVITNFKSLIRINPLSKNWQQFAYLSSKHVTMRKVKSIAINLILQAMHT
jgi:hypothetical protein